MAVSAPRAANEGRWQDLGHGLFRLTAGARGRAYDEGGNSDLDSIHVATADSNRLRGRRRALRFDMRVPVRSQTWIDRDTE
jgi:hypothetical protein